MQSSPHPPVQSCLHLDKQVVAHAHRTERLLAWIDESEFSQGDDAGAYLLAAAIGSVDAAMSVREQVSALRLPGQVKLHWRDEAEGRRLTIAQFVSSCSLRHVVVVRSGRSNDRSERRRRKCLERLLYELELRGVAEVLLESRGPADDRRDIQMVNALRGQKYLTASMRLRHAVGRSEPLLWIPDAVCGAVNSARRGTPTYQALLGDSLTVIEI